MFDLAFPSSGTVRYGTVRCVITYTAQVVSMLKDEGAFQKMNADERTAAMMRRPEFTFVNPALKLGRKRHGRYGDGYI
jgi:hypothetical protein